MPVDFAPNDPASAVLGSFGELLLEAPDASCRWNGFPVQIYAAPYLGGGGAVQATTTQLSQFTVPIPGGGSPSDAQWPYLYLDDPEGHVRAGDTLELDISFRSDGSGTVTVTDQYNGGIWSSNFTGGGGHGFANQAALTPDCAQIGCPNGPLRSIVSFAPFNPLINIHIGNGVLTLRWVGGGTPSSEIYIACEDFAITFAPPGCDGAAEKQLDGFDISGVVSPPDTDWTNEIVPGDGGMASTGTWPVAPWGVVPSGSYGSMFWNGSTFEPGDAAWVITSGPDLFTGTEAMYAFVGLENPGAAGVNGYMLKGTETDVSIYRIDAGALTLLDTFTLPLPLTGIPDGTAAGFRIFRSVGGQIGAGYTYPGASFGGSMFRFVGSVSDTTYTGPGRIGMAADSSATGMVKVFGGGAIDGSIFPGLKIILATNSCGVVTTTWNAIKSALDVLNVAGSVPIRATVIGTHGSFSAEPGIGALEGAVCTGTVGSTPGG